MIKTDEAKIILNIVAVSVVVAMTVYGTVLPNGANDSPANSTANPFSSDLIYVADDYETIREAANNTSEK